MNIGGSRSGALFSDDNQKFRYSLWRKWDIGGDCLLFIGLNPSTANGTKDDPTIRRLIGFAKSWGYSGLYAGNLFSLVSADPTRLFFEASPELRGGPNDMAIKRMRELSSKVMVGWGNWGAAAGTRPQDVIAILGEPVYCLKTTQVGEPGHPLYIRSTTELEPYIRSK